MKHNITLKPKEKIEFCILMGVVDRVVVWRRDGLPLTNRKRRVHSTVGFHMVGKEKLTVHLAHGTNHPGRKQYALCNQALNELLPILVGMV